MNPYSTPSSEPTSPAESVQQVAELTIGQIAKPVFLAWEKLRVVYVVLVGLLVLLLVGPNVFKPRTIMTICEGAIFANVCFFAGPCIETYVRWLGYRGRVLRWFLFISGTLLTMFLALISFADQLLPDQD